MEKEQNYSFIEHRMNAYSIFRYGFMLSLFTGALHLFLLTLNGSVISDLFPELFSATSFSIFILYAYISFFYYMFHLFSRYRYYTYAEIHENKWYAFIMAGHSSLHMIFLKLIIRLLEILLCYTVGFLFVFGISIFLRYPFLMEQLPSLYIHGFVDLAVLIILNMVVSLFCKQKQLALYAVFFIGAAVLYLKITTGYYAVISNADHMKKLSDLFHAQISSYLFYVFFLFIISVILIVWYASYDSSYTNYFYYHKDLDFQDDIRIVCKDETGCHPVKESYYLGNTSFRWFSYIVRFGMSWIIIVLILMNLFVLAISLSSIHPQWNIFKIHPIIVRSDSMEPAIHYNDLVFFTQDVHSRELKQQDIILYRSYTHNINIARIITMNSDELIVDLDQYPDGFSDGSLQEEIEYKQIEGVYHSSSRWLGLIVLFANTFIGRIIMLLVPCILIFYYRQITAVILGMSHRGRE